MFNFLNKQDRNLKRKLINE
uniref:Uncharacterized protein n=1 Tax=Rhizophora mucronata TaxID=61149 RepID=A0A2P2Q797_RHIMU